MILKFNYLWTIVLVCFTGSLNAQLCQLIPSDGELQDYFGSAVDVDRQGTLAVVGAEGQGAGCAYIFQLEGGWQQMQKITIPSNEEARFGNAVAMSADGNYLAVGAINYENKGAVFVYKNTAGVWSLDTKIMPDELSEEDQFGVSIDINEDGSVLAIGAIGSDVKGLESGATYVYTRTGIDWDLSKILLPVDLSTGDQFGCSVALDDTGNHIVVGAKGDDELAAESGAAYYYNNNGTTWVIRSKLLPNEIHPFAAFAEDVSMNESGDKIVIGASLESNNGFASGSAYVYSRAIDVWNFEAKLVASDSQMADLFGEDVHISGDGATVLVGSALSDVLEVDDGAVYVFTDSGEGWIEEDKYTAVESSYLGYGVTIDQDGRTKVMGALLKDQGGNVDMGTAYSDNCGVDHCGDGIRNGDETGVDCGGSCESCDIFVCDNELNVSDFERGWGIWNYESYLIRRQIQVNPLEGTFSFSVTLRGKNENDAIHTDLLNLAGYSGISVSFDYKPSSMEAGDAFQLQLSTDGGDTYTTVRKWTTGVDFENNKSYSDIHVIEQELTSTSRLRFQSKSSSNWDLVDIDQITLTTCEYQTKELEEELDNVAFDVAPRSVIPSSTTLQLYPNPTNGKTQIAFALEAEETIEITLYDLNGRLVKTILPRQELLAEQYEYSFLTNDLDAGIYLVRLDGDITRTYKKLVVFKN